MSSHGMMSTVRRRLQGVVFVAVVALLVTLSVATYQNVFTSVVKVTLRTDHLGNQLAAASDVKVRGLLVGEVRAVRSQGNGAELELALQPDKVGLIPANVSARLLPKTLFGERYVNLVLPERPAGGLRAGDVIAQDRSSSAIELEKVLTDLMPVLQAVQPEKLSTTLSAISTALHGRGKPLGDTLVQLDSYLGQVNPQLPNLKADISKLADVADTYDRAAPDLLQALTDLTVTSRTVVDQRANLESLYGTLTTASQDLTGFLETNRNNLIQVSAASRPTLAILARYAPEYPCLLKQIADFVPRIDQVFGKGTDHPGFHLTLEINANRGKYLPNQDEPRYGDKRGPRCYQLPANPVPFPQYPPDGPIKDGSRPPGAGRPAPNGLLSPVTGLATSPSSASAGLGLANSQQENDFLATLLAPALGVRPNDVPGWSGLLVGPLFRGTEVTLR